MAPLFSCFRDLHLRVWGDPSARSQPCDAPPPFAFLLHSACLCPLANIFSPLTSQPSVPVEPFIFSTCELYLFEGVCGMSVLVSLRLPVCDVWGVESTGTACAS